MRFSLESFHMVALQQMQKTGSLPDTLLASLANGNIPSFQNVMAEHRMIACEEPTSIELGFIYNNHSGYYSVSFTEGFIGEKLYYFTGKQSGVIFDLSLQDGGINKSFCGNFFQTKESERELATLIDQYWGKHSLLSILNYERESKNADYINKSYLPYVFEDKKNKIQLLYSDELFYIPKNVHIIGLMNTADRSLAMIDYALRRRFAFFDLKPGFSSNGFNSYQSDIDYPIFDNIIAVMEELNAAIKDDETLGEGFRIGHSYFCNLGDEEDIEEKLNYIVEYEIIPLLKEYWFDEPTKVEDWSEKLRNSLNE